MLTQWQNFQASGCKGGVQATPARVVPRTPKRATPWTAAWPQGRGFVVYSGASVAGMLIAVASDVVRARPLAASSSFSSQLGAGTCATPGGCPQAPAGST